MTMEQVTLVDRYFKRIGLSGDTRVETLVHGEQFSEREADQVVSVLDQILQAHTCTIPFENLDPLIGRRFTIDVDTIASTLIEKKRGGYCHQHGALLREILTELGLKTRPILARVYANPHRVAAGGLTHQSSIVTVADEEYLVDAGFGGGTPTVALPLSAAFAGKQGQQRRSAFGTYRAVPARDVLPTSLRADCTVVIQAKPTGASEFRNLYGFRDHDWESADLDMANWYTMTKLGTVFTDGLAIAMNVPGGGRKTLSNRRFRVVSAGETSESTTHEISTIAEFSAVLHESFGIEIDDEQIATVWKAIETD